MDPQPFVAHAGHPAGPIDPTPLLDDVIRAAVAATGLSVNAVAKGAGVASPVLNRFVNERRGISLVTADKLCRFLGLHLVPVTSRYGVCRMPPTPERATRAVKLPSARKP